MQSDKQTEVVDRAPLRILIACGDTAYAATLEDFMDGRTLSGSGGAGCEIERCHDAQGVLRLTSRRSYDILVLDLDLEREGDLNLVTFVHEQDPSTRLILLFDVMQVERALEGIRQGAYFYLPKTSPPSDVALVVEKALRNKAAEMSLGAYEQSVFEELVGHTEAMRRIIELIGKVAPTDSTVLLLGESGTGKEVLANTVHRLSRRKDKPFIAINCAALPEALLESEMFGHVKGAFTGADSDKRGLFEEADGGTLFLDEVGDMALITQAKLLRVLQNGEIRPVGSANVKRVDVRIIAATNRDLLGDVQNNTFREDLYYRLNVVQIRIPPLRERMGALPSLVNHFLARYTTNYGKVVRGVDEHAMSLLHHYEFPGNVRELESVIAHAVIMADGDFITARDLPEQVRQGISPRLALPYNAEADLKTLAEVEEHHIRLALARLDGNQTQAAKKLGISRSTLWRKMKEYGIEA